MGITVSPATAASGGGGGTSLPVVPGTSVEQEIYTDVGFSTGDYVYRYGRGSVGALSFPINVALATSSTVLGGAFKQYPAVSKQLAKSDIVAPTGVPISGVYSGASIALASTALAETSLQATSIAGNPDACLLSNGNIVSIFTPTSPVTTLLFQISTPAGVAVANGTVTTTLRNTTAYSTPYSVCALNGNGFVVAYENSSDSYMHTVVYNSAGGVTRADANSSGTQVAYYPFLAVNASDTIYLSWARNANASNVGDLTFLTSAGARSTTVDSGSVYATGKSAIAVAPNGNIGWAMTDIGNSGSPGNTSRIYNSALTSNISNQGSSFYTYGSNSVVAFSDNNFLFSYSGSSIAGFTAYNAASNNWGNSSSFSGLTQVFKAIPYSGTTTASPLSTNSSALILMSRSGAYEVGVVTFNAAAGNTFTYTANAIAMAGGGLVLYPALFALANGTFAYVYRSPTPNPSLRTFNSYSVSSGATFVVPSSAYLSLANNYALLGVATTTAAAGTTGTIIINGQAPLSVSYGTSSTPVWFDYNPLNKPDPAAGNTGYVVNRTVILKGLEQ